MELVLRPVGKFGRRLNGQHAELLDEVGIEAAARGIAAQLGEAGLVVERGAIGTFTGEGVDDAVVDGDVGYAVVLAVLVVAGPDDQALAVDPLGDGGPRRGTVT